MVIPKTKDGKHIQVIQRLLNICTAWSDKTGLKFNEKKCNVVNIGRSKKPKEDFYLKEEKLDFVDKAKILGVTIQANTNAKIYENNRKVATRNGTLIQARLKTFFKGI